MQKRTVGHTLLHSAGIHLIHSYIFVHCCNRYVCWTSSQHARLGKATVVIFDQIVDNIWQSARCGGLQHAAPCEDAMAAAKRPPSPCPVCSWWGCTRYPLFYFTNSEIWSSRKLVCRLRTTCSCSVVTSLAASCNFSMNEGQK